MREVCVILGSSTTKRAKYNSFKLFCSSSLVLLLLLLSTFYSFNHKTKLGRHIKFKIVLCCVYANAKAVDFPLLPRQNGECSEKQSFHELWCVSETKYIHCQCSNGIHTHTLSFDTLGPTFSSTRHLTALSQRKEKKRNNNIKLHDNFSLYKVRLHSQKQWQHITKRARLWETFRQQEINYHFGRKWTIPFCSTFGN